MVCITPLAIGLGAYGTALVVILDGLGKQLCRTGGILVGDYHHGEVHLIGVTGAQHLGVTVVIGSRYQIAFGQQGIQHIHHRVNGAAGVVAHIKDQRLDAIAGELLEGGIELGRSIVVELLDLDVAPHRRTVPR